MNNSKNGIFQLGILQRIMNMMDRNFKLLKEENTEHLLIITI